MPLHPPGTIENGLDEEAYLGVVDSNTLPQVVSKVASGEKQIDLGEIIGLPDFDVSSSSQVGMKADHVRRRRRST